MEYNGGEPLTIRRMKMYYQAVLVYYACMSIIAFAMYGIDKHRATRNQWRIKESLLLGISFLGGAVGALLGMRVFRHKTKHRYFLFVGFLGIVWQGALVTYLIKMGI